jgi:dienelactone hydrolase
LLADHGYGVLALDLRGHGESDGRSTSAPWKAQEDIDGALDWLSRRRDVDAERLGLVGVSFGGEVALQVAGRRRDVRATVAEGAQGGPTDARAAGADAATVAQLTVMSALADVLTGGRSKPDGELVERIAPRPLLLISAGRATEADANRVFARRGGAATDHWNLPDAPHAQAARTQPAEYERRVVAFLDRALRR